jgi:hypothetical protein
MHETITAIGRLVSDFVNRNHTLNSTSPNRLFIGQKEYASLCTELKYNGGPFPEQLILTRFMGMKVIRVSKDSHLAVEIDIAKRFLR